MSANGWLQFAFFSIVLLATVRPVGAYLARVLEGERTWLDPILRPIEKIIYKLSGVNAEQEMNWREYAFAMLGFSAVTLVATYVMERVQAHLPWNPQGLANIGPDLAWNTAVSFTTNTNWQFYTPETTMSYLTQMAGLATHNFWSAAAGIAIAAALIRGIKRTGSGTIGNFWVDTTRILLYVLIPASLIYALLLVGQGVPQNMHAYTTAHPLEQLRRRRPLRRVRLLRRKQSRCWAPMAADSSTPTALTRSRTRRRSRTSCRFFRSSLFPRVLLTRWDV
jgi:K+-transporting ATPase ATPase A chain